MFYVARCFDDGGKASKKCDNACQVSDSVTPSYELD